MFSRRVLGAAVLATASIVAVPLQAQADPVNSPTTTLVALACDNGHTYTVAYHGNGGFTAAQDVNSTSVFVPTALGEVTGTVLDPDGNVVGTFTEPPRSKGASSKPRTTTTTECSFRFRHPVEGGFSHILEGTITGFLTPLR